MFSRIRKPTPTSLFIYALAITVLAFVFKDIRQLAVIGLVNGFLGIYFGLRRYKWIILLLLLSAWGTFLNALAVSNTGPTLYQFGPITIKEGAIHATIAITLRLTSIAGAALIFFALTKPRDIIRYLESELRIPKGISFAIAYAIRLFPLMQKDYREIQIARMERGFRKTPLSPSDIKSILLPLLSLGYERAIWVGIAAELRGFRLRETRKRKPIFGIPEAFILTLLLLQVILALVPYM